MVLVEEDMEEEGAMNEVFWYLSGGPARIFCSSQFLQPA